MSGNESTGPVRERAALRRALGLPLLSFYGLGTILGAGIYALVGKVAGVAGMYSPVAFVVAGAIAAFTAVSYAEMAARIPKSGGEAAWVHAGLRRPWLSMLVGWAIVLTGTVSSATLTVAFVGYLTELAPIAPILAKVLVVAACAALAVWGISESVTVASALTVVEIGGLLLVLLLAGGSLAELPARAGELVPPLEAGALHDIGLGAFLAFYAVIGFEDIVNVAEEAKRPRRDLPLAIFIALVVSTALYVVVALVAVLALPAEELARTDAPLARIVEGAGHSSSGITVISLFAIVNGALIQVIMASRVIYGMAEQGSAPRWLGAVHPDRRTPMRATLLVSAGVLVLALGFGIVALASATSFIILVVFALVHVSLMVLKRRDPDPEGVATYPGWVPVLGLTLCLAFLGLKLASAS